jgi:hypothetical protein
MDDITPRRDYRGERRDFSAPGRQPMPGRPAEPVTPPPAYHRPVHHQPEPSYHNPAPDPFPMPRQTQSAQPAGHQSMDIAPPAYHRPVHQPQTAAQAQPSQRRPKLSVSPKMAAVFIGILLIAGLGFHFLKPAKAQGFRPSDLAKQASFSVYYPQPLPAGYTYDQSVSTFANNQAYFLINKGTEHIIVREQAWSSNSLDTSSLTNPAPVDTPVGKAAIGTNTGQASAVVLVNSTLITVTSNGYVPAADVTTMINNLKNIGQKH